LQCETGWAAEHDVTPYREAMTFYIKPSQWSNGGGVECHATPVRRGVVVKKKMWRKRNENQALLSFYPS
jgi:hypothetical protein